MKKEEQNVSQNMHKVLKENRDAKIVSAVRNRRVERSILTAAIRLGLQYVN